MAYARHRYTSSMFELRENVSSAIQSLTSSWLRTALTTLGMTIGVASVTLLISIGLGVQKEVTEQIEGLGVNLIFVVPGKLEKDDTPNTLALLGVSTLTNRDVDELRSLESVRRVAPFIFVGGTVDYGGAPHSAFVVATRPDWFQMRPRPLSEGRLFSSSEENAPVCVIAEAQRDAIFGNRPALGETVTVQGVPFQVIGVLKGEPASALFGDAGFENMIFLPAAAAQAQIPQTQINRIILQTNPETSPEKALDEVSGVLRRTHEEHEDFGVLTQSQILGRVYRLMNIVTALLSGISAISLVVAGIGIMNIMLFTVSERTHEIGVRKAVGARRRDIFIHFLVEALAISLLGGTAGLTAAAILGELVRWYSPLTPMVTPSVVALALGVCVAVGVLFGTAPALRASRLDPIESLRRE